ncbi:MAG TPA: glucose-1-phosphate adenylyltransferase [Planctomycetaceae bacterium]|nr:glucose-1-phosphate adenylyltransferase [Planctomycetaceae bacterium]
MRNLIGVVLGGGKGTRLYPLTEYRSKPAVPLAGKYRLIDIPISNCINSGINRIYLLTQFNSVSLHRHIRQAYHFDRFSAGFVEILAAQQTMEGEQWYQGTADAVRQNMRYIEQPGIDYVLILSGDQLYRMDYRDMLRTHRESRADVTIGAVPVSSDQAAAFGIMRLDDNGRVQGFLEKPKTEDELSIVRTDPKWIDRWGIASRGRDCLANMGIYLFNRDTLVELLTKSDYQDFGREVFPMSIRTRKVQVHLFDGYWEDIGTIKAFYDANLALAAPNPPFEFVVEGAPIYTRARFLPPTRLGNVTVRNSLIADGCVVGDGTVIENSVIGLRCRIGRNVRVRNSVLMGADYYGPVEALRGEPAVLGVGEGALIEGAIIDKDCRIGRKVTIQPREGLGPEGDFGEVVIRDGVIVVKKGAELGEGWSL